MSGAVRDELDRACTHTDQPPLLPDPGQLGDMRPGELAEEHGGERSLLPVVAALVDVKPDRPRRPRFVVVVAHDERRGEAAQVDVPDAALVDLPREHAEADAVGGAPARDAADHPARADRLAVARLEVRAAHAEAPGIQAIA